MPNEQRAFIAIAHRTMRATNWKIKQWKILVVFFKCVILESSNKGDIDKRQHCDALRETIQNDHEQPPTTAMLWSQKIKYTNKYKKKETYIHFIPFYLSLSLTHQVQSIGLFVLFDGLPFDKTVCDIEWLHSIFHKHLDEQCVDILWIASCIGKFHISWKEKPAPQITI